MHIKSVEIIYIFLYIYIYIFAQSGGAVECTDCFSVEGYPHSSKCPDYDTKQYDGEVPVILELWGMRRTPSLPSLPGKHLFGVVAPDKGPIYGLNRTKPWFLDLTVFASKLCIYVKRELFQIELF